MNHTEIRKITNDIELEPKVKTTKKEKWLDIMEEFKYWGKFTTFHGLPIIFRAPNFALRIFWFAIFLAASSLCCFMLVSTFTQYFSYQVVTKIRAVPKRNMSLGSFTLCSSNFLNTNKAFEMLKDRLRQKFNIDVSTYKQLVDYSKELNVSLTDEISLIQEEVYFKGIKNSTLVKNYGYSIDDLFFK